MSTGIVSSKEGHDESHINDMKLGAKFWNIIYNVTIGLNQSTDIKDFLTAEVNFFIPLNIGWHDKSLSSMTIDQTDTQCDSGQYNLSKKSKE